MGLEGRCAEVVLSGACSKKLTCDERTQYELDEEGAPWHNLPIADNAFKVNKNAYA